MLCRKFIISLFAFASLTAALHVPASEFAVEVVEYHPAPGQFVNNTDYNDPTRALGPPVGGTVAIADNTSCVSLGSFGGRIVLRFDHTVMDDPRNPMGLDSIVFGNAVWKAGYEYWRWQEPGHIEISRDMNENGVPDDIWYLIPGSHSDYPSLYWTGVTYHESDPAYPPNPDYKDHYPSVIYFPNYPRPSVSFFHILLPDDISGDFENPNEGFSYKEEVWGYCDLSPVIEDTMGDGGIYLVPDNPYTVGLIQESGGGDSFDIADAIDPVTGQPAGIDGFDFIRITGGSNLIDIIPPWLLLEISTEIDAASDVQNLDEIRGLWNMDYDNPSQADSSSYGNFGAVHGAVFVSSGRRNGAYEFDGVDDHILVDEHFTLDIVDEITFDCWIKLAQLPSVKSLPPTDATIVAKGIHNTATEMNYELVVNSDDYLEFRTYDEGWHTLQADLPFSVEDIGAWHHIALTYSRKSGIAKLFLDMRCIGMATLNGKLVMNEQDLSIGGRLVESGTDKKFPGTIDEVCIECVEKISSAYQRCWTVDGDTDEDGLPDFWEMEHFTSLNAKPDDDPDKDGKVNSVEYPSGTDPNDPDSFFDITLLSLDGQGAEISVKTVKGWKYAILWTDDLDIQDWQCCGFLIGDGTTMTFTDNGDTYPPRSSPDSPTVTSRFYKVIAE